MIRKRGVFGEILFSISVLYYTYTISIFLTFWKQAVIKLSGNKFLKQVQVRVLLFAQATLNTVHDKKKEKIYIQNNVSLC